MKLDFEIRGNGLLKLPWFSVERFVSLIVLVAFLGIPNVANADLFLDLEDNLVATHFDGDGVGDAAGPFDIDGESVNFTTVGLSSGTLSTSSFGLGMDSGVDDPDSMSFNIGESWSLMSDQSLLLTEIEIGGLQSEETFSIQSDAWINLAGINSGDGVTYQSNTGTFVLTDGPDNDLFSLAELTGGTTLTFNVGSTITFGNLTSSFGPNDDVEIENLTFQLNPVPEPGAVWLLGTGLLVICTRRFRSRSNFAGQRYEI